MHLSPALLLRGIGWITGMFILSNIIRFGSNVYLTQVLTPELMGAVLIIMTLRNAIELLSDVGIGQNIVTNKAGDDPLFKSTAWFIQAGRGLVLSVILYVAAGQIAALYGVPATAIELAAATLLANGLSSVSIYALQRKLGFSHLARFDLAQDLCSSLLVVLAATLSPTIWALVAANFIATLVRTATTYMIAPRDSSAGFSRQHAMEILRFGKWIFLTSVLMLLCTYFDRLYLGQAAPLALLGVYGIARSLSDIPAVLVGRISNMLIFPVVASASTKPRCELRAELSGTRWRVLAVGAVAMGAGLALADLGVKAIYDSRYHGAGAMLPLLLLGLWVAILANINDFALLGLARPAYGAVGNILKVAFLIIGLPLALAWGGILLAIAVFAASDLLRLIPIAVGLRNEALSFLRQDFTATLIFAGTAAAMSAVRYTMGWGSFFDAIAY